MASSKKRKKVSFADDTEYTKYKGPRPNKKLVEKPRSEDTPNIGPRTEPARKAVILMNRLKHRPKSVIIQTHDEIVVQVRGEFEHLVKKLRKVFGSKGKDTTVNDFHTHDWKLKGLGLMNVYWRESNSFCSVRFKNIPFFLIKEEPEPEAPVPTHTTVAAPSPTPITATESVEDPDAILLD